MGFNTNNNSNCEETCETLCEQLEKVNLQCIGNVDTAGLSDNDILCYHADSGNFINVSKTDLFDQFDIDIDGGTYSAYSITLTDENSPDIVIDISGLPTDLCNDADFIASLKVKVLQNASEVPTTSTYFADIENQDEWNKEAETCFADLKAKIDQNTTYTFSNAVPNADGSACIFTVTGSDGSTQPVTVPKPVIPADTGLYLDGSAEPVLDIPNGTVTWATINDGDGTAGAPLVQNIGPLLAALTSPVYNFTGSLTAVDNGDGTITVNGVDTDTAVTITENADGSITLTPADGGTPVVIPAPVAQAKCGGTLAPTDKVVIDTQFQEYDQAIHFAPAGGLDRLVKRDANCLLYQVPSIHRQDRARVGVTIDWVAVGNVEIDLPTISVDITNNHRNPMETWVELRAQNYLTAPFGETWGETHRMFVSVDSGAFNVRMPGGNTLTHNNTDSSSVSTRQSANAFESLDLGTIPSGGTKTVDMFYRVTPAGHTNFHANMLGVYDIMAHLHGSTSGYN